MDKITSDAEMSYVCPVLNKQTESSEFGITYQFGDYYIVIDCKCGEKHLLEG